MRFRVTRWFKGGERDTLTIRPDLFEGSHSSCALPVRRGEQWLIFSELDSLGVPYTALCRGSRLRTEADSLLKYLGTGWAPRTR